MQPSTFMETAGKPRLITAEEVLAERASMREEMALSHVFTYVCDLDPTGEETAKYLNMEYPSIFNGREHLPSFVSSELAKESYLAHLKPGFYIGNAKKPATLEDVTLVLTPPLPLRPKRILNIAYNYVWDEFILSPATMTWKRNTYIKGQAIWYKPNEYTAIPFAELPVLLNELFGKAPSMEARYRHVMNPEDEEYD
jgi:hypothetical protein